MLVNGISIWICGIVHSSWTQHTQLIDGGGNIIVIRIKLAKSKSIWFIATAWMSLFCLFSLYLKSQIMIVATLTFKSRTVESFDLIGKIEFWSENFVWRQWVGTAGWRGFCTFRTELCMLIFIHGHVYHAFKHILSYPSTLFVQLEQMVLSKFSLRVFCIGNYMFKMSNLELNKKREVESMEITKR